MFWVHQGPGLLAREEEAFRKEVRLRFSPQVLANYFKRSEKDGLSEKDSPQMTQHTVDSIYICCLLYTSDAADE